MKETADEIDILVLCGSVTQQQQKVEAHVRESVVAFDRASYFSLKT